MFKQSKPALTILVAAVAVALMWGALSLSAPPPGKGGGKGGGGEDTDTTPPAAVTDLEVEVIATTSSSITLTWTATADDGYDPEGPPASVYDIRHSTSPITDENFSSATKVRCEPDPATPGVLEIMTVGDLSELTVYDLALKVADAAGNWSAISNVVVDTTGETPSGVWAFDVADPLGGTQRYFSLALAYDLSENPNPSIAYVHVETGSFGQSVGPVRLASWNGTGWEIELIEDQVGRGVALVYDPTSKEATVSYGFSFSPNVAGKPGAPPSLNFARRDDVSGIWSIEIIDDSTGGFGYTSLAYYCDLSSNWNPSISYQYRSRKKDNPGLKFAFWDAGTSSWVLEMVDPGDESDAIGNSLAYDPDTREATIAYHREETLKFCRRKVPESGPPFWNIEVIATETGNQWLKGVSLAYDPVSGNPSIAFRVISPDIPGDHILKFARWDGSSWVIEEVDTCASCGEGNSLAYDAAGIAHISYTADEGHFGDGATRVVKLASRNGPDDPWVVNIVTSCVAAYPTSLKFDPNGNPSVAYSNELNVNDQLKFARIVP